MSSSFQVFSTQQIGHRAARLLLYNLQIASNNLRNTRPPSWDSRLATLDDSPIRPSTPYAESIQRMMLKAKKRDYPEAAQTVAASGAEG